MPGQYVVVARPAGTLITELIYNNDHQNHVDGRAAAEMGAYGISLSQYQLAEDPLPGGVESLPPSMAGEITRLRFVLAQIIGELSGSTPVNWYDAMGSPALPVLGARVQRTTALTIPHNSATVISFSGATIEFNTGVYDDMSQPTRFTAPVAGKYLAFCSVTWVAVATGIRQLGLGVNGTFSGNAVTSSLGSASQTQPQTISGLLDLNANDYVQFRVFQNGGSNLSLVLDSGLSIVGGLIAFGS